MPTPAESVATDTTKEAQRAVRYNARLSRAGTLASPEAFTYFYLQQDDDDGGALMCPSRYTSDELFSLCEMLAQRGDAFLSQFRCVLGAFLAHPETDKEVADPYEQWLDLLQTAAAADATQLIDQVLMAKPFHGCNYSEEHPVDATALSAAASTGSLRTVEYMLGNPCFALSSAALQEAAGGGHHECLKALIDAAVGDECLDRLTDTVCYNAAGSGCLETMRLCLNRRPKERLKLLPCVLVHAAANGDREMLVLLRHEAGDGEATANVIHPSKFTLREQGAACAAAAASGNPEAFKLLVCTQPVARRGFMFMPDVSTARAAVATGNVGFAADVLAASVEWGPACPLAAGVWDEAIKCVVGEDAGFGMLDLLKEHECTAPDYDTIPEQRKFFVDELHRLAKIDGEELSLVVRLLTYFETKVKGAVLPRGLSSDNVKNMGRHTTTFIETYFL